MKKKIKLIEQLIEYGANVHDKNADGFTCLDCLKHFGPAMMDFVKCHENIRRFIEAGLM